MNNAREQYGEIIDHPHHVSKKRKPMSQLNRAAQFAPFAALTGYDDLISESARETTEFVELDADQKELINRKLLLLIHHGNDIQATFVYYVQDDRKAGGHYVSETASLSSYDEYSHTILLSTGTQIDIDSISSINGGGSLLED